MAKFSSTISPYSSGFSAFYEGGEKILDKKIEYTLISNLWLKIVNLINVLNVVKKLSLGKNIPTRV